MKTSLIRRGIRFHLFESLWWFAGLAAGLLLLLKNFIKEPFLLLSLCMGYIIAFFVPWIFRRRVALQYEKLKRNFFYAGIAFSMLLIGMKFSGHQPLGVAIFCHFFSFMIGFLFWTSSDDIYFMISWLSHPLEYGRPPDEIRLLAKRKDGKDLNCLWRYRYEDKWDVGITGAVTFGFEDGRCNAMSIDEIFREYLGWNQQEGIQKIIEDQISKDSKI